MLLCIVNWQFLTCNVTVRVVHAVAFRPFSKQQLQTCIYTKKPWYLWSVPWYLYSVPTYTNRYATTQNMWVFTASGSTLGTPPPTLRRLLSFWKTTWPCLNTSTCGSSMSTGNTMTGRTWLAMLSRGAAWSMEGQQGTWGARTRMYASCTPS